MRERDRHLGGELTIESNEFGTRLSVIFPAKTPPISSRDTVQQIEVA
jgi:signal transduction histidine kinase